MSSKKARRRQAREQSEEASRRRMSPATIFILAIGLALLLTLAGSIIFADREEPLFPEGVWSPEQGHWR